MEFILDNKSNTIKCDFLLSGYTRYTQGKHSTTVAVLVNVTTHAHNA